jgi:hypothetical protein
MSRPAGTSDAPRAAMKTRPCLAAILLVAASPFIGCAKQQNHGPVQWSASNPSSAVGQTEAQAWSRSTSNDKVPPPPRSEPSPGPGTVGPPAISTAPAAIELPAGASLAASATTREVRTVPQGNQRTPGTGETVEAFAVHGSDRVYQTELSYGDAVAFFDRTLPKDGVEASRRSATRTETSWSVRCAGGARAIVAVRSTQPTTIEVVEANEAEPPSGVTNPQAAGPRTP